MQTSPNETTEATETANEAPRFINSTDATVGKPIVERVLLRQAELEEALAACEDPNGHLYAEIALALSTVDSLLSGDLKNVPAVVVADMNNWLERNKHVAESAIVSA